MSSPHPPSPLSSEDSRTHPKTKTRLHVPFRFANRFYDCSPWLIVPLTTVMMIATIVMVYYLMNFDDYFVGLGLLSLVLTAPVLMFLSTPFLRVVGMFKYYSSLFLIIGNPKKKIELHSGTGIDYLLHLRGVSTGEEMKRTVLGFYLQGLLNIAAKVETLPDPAAVEIVGSSWFFSDRSVERMGFTVTSAGWFHRLNMLFGFVELTILNSLTAGHLALPNVLKVKQASMNGQTLLDHRDYIQRLYDRIATERNRTFEIVTDQSKLITED